MDAVFRTAPRWRVTMPATKSVHRSTTASTFVRIMASSAARSALCTGPMVVKPALLTRMSGVRPRSANRAGSVPRASASVRSAAMTSVRTACARRQLVRQRPQPVFAPRHQGQAVAAAGELSGDLGADARRGARDDRCRVVLRGGERHELSVGDPSERCRWRAGHSRSRMDEVRVTASRPTRVFAKAQFAWGSHGAGRGRYLVPARGNWSTRRCPEWKGASDVIDTLDRGGRSTGLSLRHRCRFRWRSE